MFRKELLNVTASTATAKDVFNAWRVCEVVKVPVPVPTKSHLQEILIAGHNKFYFKKMPKFSVHDSDLSSIKSDIKTLQEQVKTLQAEVQLLKGQETLGGRKSRKQELAETDEPAVKKQKFDGITLPCGTGKSSDDPVHVFTDGACGSNGRKGAAAGIGVYWGPDHPLNTSERIGGRQTNNRAEIHAAVKALKQAREMGAIHVTLYTDSSFLINSITKWINKWKKNGWKLTDGGLVKNKEDFEELDSVRTGLKVEWVHVSGHSGIEGNEKADQLAVAALKLPPIPDTID